MKLQMRKRQSWLVSFVILFTGVSLDIWILSHSTNTTWNNCLSLFLKLLNNTRVSTPDAEYLLISSCLWLYLPYELNWKSFSKTVIKCSSVTLIMKLFRWNFWMMWSHSWLIQICTTHDSAFLNQAEKQ